MVREIRAGSSLLSLLVLASCSQASEVATDPKPRAGTPSAAVEAEGDDEPEPAFETVLEIEVDAPETKTAANSVETASVEPSPASVQWREVGRFDAPLSFVYFASGALARSELGVYALDEEGGLSLRPQLELPDQPLLGRWPDDAWYVTRTKLEGQAKPKSGEPERSFEHQLMHLDGAGQWAPGKHKGKTSWVGAELDFHKGWRGGMLMREGSTLTPVGARGNTMKIGPRMGKVIVEVFEAPSGAVYTVSSRPTGYYVQRKCSNFACVEENAKKLPYGSEWSFGADVPRHRHGLSILAKVEDDGLSIHHLLHAGTQGWKLESLIHPPTGLWSTSEGGLWITLGDQLWFRDAEEAWHDVELPAGADSISAAMVIEGEELWIAASVGSGGVVFATAAAGPGA